MADFSFEIKRVLSVLLAVSALTPICAVSAQPIEVVPQVESSPLPSAAIPSAGIGAQTVLPKARTSALIIHTPPKGKTLPSPGVPIELVVRLRNTKNSELKMSALIVRDGQVMDVVQPNARFNEQDEPTYKFLINAPVSELQYQFLLHQQDAVLMSEKYLVRRGCLPALTATDTTVDKTLTADKLVIQLMTQAQGLEQDINNLQRVIEITTELKKLTGEEGK